MVPTVLDSEVESDPYLISLVRGGDMEAFGQLYERHVAAARRLARVLTNNPSDADDLVAETFTKVLTALRSGHGPDTAVRAYLLTALRHAVYDRGKHAKRIEYTDDLTPYERPAPAEDPAVRMLERTYAAAAFAKLPERWRAVLWHTEVEGESPAQVAPLLGLTPNGVAALAYRARERLRQMYLQEHIGLTDAPRCHWTGMHLAGYVRAQLARRDRSKVEDHLAECANCRVLHRELTEENSGLRGVLATVLLGTAATGYLEDTSRGAGLLAAIGGSVAALWHWLAGWWSGLTSAISNGWHHLTGLPRSLIERYGPGNVAAAGGVAAAALAGVVTFAVVAVQNGPSTEDNGALPQPAPATARQPQPTPLPTLPPYIPNTVSPSAPSKPPVAKPSAPAKPGSMTAAKPVLTSDPSAAQLSAGEDGILPIAVRFPENTAPRKDVTFTAHVPGEMTLRDSDAGEGWSCKAPQPTQIVCTLPSTASPRSSTARIPVAVAAGLTGYTPIGLEVENERSTMRVPIAPQGMRVAQALTGNGGFSLGGNALLACQSRPACLNADNNGQQMVPFAPAGREPGAPGGNPGAHAMSGARITVPAGAEVQWAGLVYTASASQGPERLIVHAPGGGWEPVSMGNNRTNDGGSRPAIQLISDVTALWKKHGSGDWWIGASDAALPSGIGQFAGWSLIVLYRDKAAPSAEIAVYLGPKGLKEKQELSVRLDTGGTVDLGVVLWDADRDLAGDALLVGQDKVDVAGGSNASALICVVTGDPCAWRIPGLDLLRRNALASPGSSATLQSGGDPMEVGLLAVLTRPAG